MKKALLYGFLMLSFLVNAQKKEKDANLPKGNEAFAEKKFNEAEAEYRVSEAKFEKKAKSSYNLGNAIYKQKQAAEAKYHYAKAVSKAKTRPERHQAYHNLGNCLMLEKDYQGAAEAYKNALRNNPNDEKTRYNYALAKRMAKDNPPKKEGNKNKDKEDKKKNKDQDKDKNKDQDKDKQKQDPKKGDGKQDNKPNESPQKQSSGINKQTLESMLDAVNNEEKKVQDKVNLQKVKGKPKPTEKDW